MIEVVLASRNQHKLQELCAILQPALPDLVLLCDDGPEPVECGTTFAENALIKASAAARRTGKPAIADDSGLAVQIMGGSPGIFSARWSGPARSDQENVALLLWQLRDVPQAHRAAAFVCAAAVAVPQLDGSLREETVVAEWPGVILQEARGANGFGYDPIFQPAGFSCAAAELEPAVKNTRSHRNRAFTALVPVLAAALQVQQE